MASTVTRHVRHRKKTQDGGLDGWMCGRVDAGQMDGWLDGQVRWLDIWMDGWLDGQCVRCVASAPQCYQTHMFGGSGGRGVSRGGAVPF